MTAAFVSRADIPMIVTVMVVAAVHQWLRMWHHHRKARRFARAIDTALKAEYLERLTDNLYAASPLMERIERRHDLNSPP